MELGICKYGKFDRFICDEKNLGVFDVYNFVKGGVCDGDGCSDGRVRIVVKRLFWLLFLLLGVLGVLGVCFFGSVE